MSFLNYCARRVGYTLLRDAFTRPRPQPKAPRVPFAYRLGLVVGLMRRRDEKDLTDSSTGTQ